MAQMERVGKKTTKMDKVTRVLTMYSRLAEGGKIYKDSFCTDAEIGRRTFDRDIEDIRMFLTETFQGRELVYSREEECYQLDHYRMRALSGMEVGFLLELLGSGRNLRKDEYAGLAGSLCRACERGRRALLEKVADRYVRTYREEKGTASLKMHWDLQQCIAGRDVIRLHLREGQKAVVSPVALWSDRRETYLFAYNGDGELAWFPADRILFFQTEGRRFDACLIEKFDSMTWEEIEGILDTASGKHKEREHEKEKD